MFNINQLSWCFLHCHHVTTPLKHYLVFLFFEVFDRDRYVSNLNFKHRVEKWIHATCGVKYALKYNTMCDGVFWFTEAWEMTTCICHLSMSTVDTRWHAENLSQILHFRLKTTLGQGQYLLIFSRYLTSVGFMFTWGTPRTQRTHVHITPSRVVLGTILVPRDVCDDPKMRVHTRSSSQETLVSDKWQVFDVEYHSWPLKIDYYSNTVSEARIEPSWIGIG